MQIADVLGIITINEIPGEFKAINTLIALLKEACVHLFSCDYEKSEFASHALFK